MIGDNDKNPPPPPPELSDDDFGIITSRIFEEPQNTKALLAQISDKDLTRRTEWGTGLTCRKILEMKRYDLIPIMIARGVDPIVLLKEGITAAGKDGNFSINAARYVRLIDSILANTDLTVIADNNQPQALRQDLFTLLIQGGSPDLIDLFAKKINLPNISLEEGLKETTNIYQDDNAYWYRLLETINYYQDKPVPENLIKYINELMDFAAKKLEGLIKKHPEYANMFANYIFNAYPVSFWLDHVSKTAPHPIIQETSRKLNQLLFPYIDEKNPQKAFNAKMVAGHLNLDGAVILPSDKPDTKPYKVLLQGLDPYWTFPSIVQSFEAFKEEQHKDPELSAVFNEVSKALQAMQRSAVNANTPQAAADILHNSQNLVSIITSGSRTHSANYGLTYIPEGPYYMLSKLNRGAGTKGYNCGIVNYKVTKPENLTEPLIQRMLQYHATPPEQFSDFHEKELEEILGLEFISKQDASRQSAASCTTVSGDMALRTILTDAFRKHFLRKNESLKDAQLHAEQQADVWYKKWSAFDRNYSFDTYFSFAANQPLSYDLLSKELFRHHDPAKSDELYRGKKILPILLKLDRERLIQEITSHLIEYEIKYESKNHNDLKAFLEAIDPELANECILKAAQESTKNFNEKYDEMVEMMRSQIQSTTDNPFFIQFLREDFWMALKDKFAKADLLRDKNGVTLLQMAKTLGNQNVSDAFAKAIKNVMTERLAGYLTATTADSGFKVFHSDLSCLGKLLDNGADIKGFYGDLMANAEPKIVGFLLENGYLKINEPDAYGKTLLMHACEKDNLDAGLLLVKKGADLDMRDRNAKNYEDYINNGEKSEFRVRQMLKQIREKPEQLEKRPEAPKSTAEKPTTHRKSTLLVQPLSKRQTNIGEPKPPKIRKVLFSKKTKTKQQVTKRNVKRNPKGSKPGKPEGR